MKRDGYKGIEDKIYACKWTIKTNLKYKYIRIQDLRLKFQKTKNVRVYMASYFRADKEVNTYYPWDIMQG